MAECSVHGLCCLSVYLSVCLSVCCLSVCLFVCLLFVCLYVCLCVCLFSCLSVCCLSVFLSVVCLSVCLSVVCLSVCLSVCLFCLSSLVHCLVTFPFLTLVSLLNAAGETPRDVARRYGQLGCASLLGSEPGGTMSIITVVTHTSVSILSTYIR